MNPTNTLALPITEFADLRKLAAELITKRQLPGRVTQSQSASYGTGAICSLCGETITSDQVEYAIRGRRAAARVTRLHLWCQAAWELEASRESHRARLATH